jgi:hypothetical protein
VRHRHASHLVLQILRADETGGLDALETQLALSIFDQIFAQSGNLATQLRELRPKYTLHLAAQRHLELQLVLAPLRRGAVGAGKHHAPSRLSWAAAGAEERECAQQRRPQPDQQADLHLLLSVGDNDHEDGGTAQGEGRDHA